MKTHRFNLVLPLAIWNKIKEFAKDNRRSVTQEIIIAIEFYLSENDR